ncbi:nuclear transport factor 2 family protein [Lentilactobacillus kisonensis]|uniref:SnoaL-like domain-containing protein n=1 Tax=Lentilactobacillus kisonensis F0435 TaxID=797516 RepID=H1LK09_9LACO|nr:nuclear transport factor 2 family protein [Lentilactobacillus kisonensis]EHO47949.1 hypothetical protein HMPREF9104_02955 [Lentilactobacillus kisonensis F0435]
MSEKEQTINQYFQLSDQASKSQAALHSIIELFADDAEIFGATGETCAGTKAITNFFTDFFNRNVKLKHLCHVFMADNHYKAEWAVSGQKKTGDLFALHGYDTYEFDSTNHIKYLKVTIAN